ncbi:MAG: M1 family metallopeptidase [Gammaproteobacteria bacterium]|nr:M1 family metallopeptidase [Gammaproteobacteria bacterium]NVK87305.1 M1 family metallopeptidase [Gammaproteobacteria bacterium]
MNKYFFPIVISLLAIVLTACVTPQRSQSTNVDTPAVASKATMVNDELTFANLDVVRTHHIDLMLNVDFKTQTLSGEAELSLNWFDASARELRLDTRELTIKSVRYLKQEAWLIAPFEMGPVDEVKGRALVIQLPEQASKVKIAYQTAPTASGLQWLSEQQTGSKKFPFMYSQSQAIHARSWIPLQDSPAIRVTYSARVNVAKPLKVVMSAESVARNDEGFHFSMPQAIPPYLIAIAAGNLQYQKMSEQTGIWAEPDILDRAVAEFDDTQKMIAITEALYGPYRWQQYDLLILPPAFPFGGMENPRLSFITPTVIAGDKSLVNLIAHELAHSWSGNLVTNATWNDLWLNEGFTSYVENRIMEEAFGVERAVMEQWLSVASLQRDLDSLAAADTRLKITLDGRDPDDAFSEVPYIKGHLFLLFLEQRFGREIFDPFVKGYFNKFAFQSLTTEQFINYLEQHLLQPNPGVVSMEEVEQWVYQPGLPANSPTPVSSAFEQVAETMAAWRANRIATGALKQVDWSVHEWLYFIESLPADLARRKIRELDRTLGLTESNNAEIQFAWYRFALTNGYREVDPAVAEFLKSVGRRKFIVPLYQLLADLSPQSKVWAADIYRQARAGYHPLAQQSIDKIFAGK